MDHSEVGNKSSEIQSGVRSLKELVDLVSGKKLVTLTSLEGDSGLAERLPFPFLALIGQREMKLALLLNIINPSIGGVLLIGPRGTGKTTAVRSLVDLLPDILRSTCHYGCTNEDIENGGMDAVCPECAKKYAEGRPLSSIDHVQLIELPLNATLENVIGGLDERAVLHNRMRIKRGILGQADMNLLFVDEVNLLQDEIIDAILDAAAQGTYTLKRSSISGTYKSRFTLIGSMNPEEGRLRPQIMDRFGLRIFVYGLSSPNERMEAYQSVIAFQQNPRKIIALYENETSIARQEIQNARQLLPSVTIPDFLMRHVINIIRDLQIDSLRAEITLFEAARAYAAADGRSEVDLQDIKIMAPMALRLRRSPFITKYFSDQEAEENQLKQLLDSTFGSKED